MEDPRDLGTNADGSRNEDYCRFCFQDGRFTDPDITVARMIEKCAGIMEEMGLRNNDIVCQVNGIRTDNLLSLLTIAQKLKTAKTIELELRRNNLPVVLKYSIR